MKKKIGFVLVVAAFLVALFENVFDRSYAYSTELEVYYLNVGQADSILISLNDENMLIDAGNNKDGDKICTFLKDKGIESLKYVVATHPHEDHIGGMDDVINEFKIEHFYMPNVITTTKTFEDMLLAMKDKNLQFETPNILDSFMLNDAKLTVLHVSNDESDLNNTSIVLKLEYGNNSFLFMGDATSEVESNIINMNIKADVLKVGHHGSSYSTTNKFLEAVNPKYAIISVGVDNSYSHPAEATLKRLKKESVTVYRTDIDNTIFITSDGKNIKVKSLEVNLDG